MLAYDGTQLVLDALERAIRASGAPERTAVAQALRNSRFQGASGEIAFDEHGNRLSAPISAYAVQQGYPGSPLP